MTFQKNYIMFIKKKNISLNKIVSKMSNLQILGFKPYNTLAYWTKNVDIVITMDKLSKLFEHFGYNIDINSFNKKNVSKKERGTFNKKTINRLKKIYRKDLILYDKIINSTKNIFNTPETTNIPDTTNIPETTSKPETTNIPDTI